MSAIDRVSSNLAQRFLLDITDKALIYSMKWKIQSFRPVQLGLPTEATVSLSQCLNTFDL